MTKEKFQAYKEVQESGETNMFAIQDVIELSDNILNREDCLDIMKNYDKYQEKYIKVTQCYCEDCGLSIPHYSDDCKCHG